MYTIYINNTLPPALAVHEIYRDIFGPPMASVDLFVLSFVLPCAYAYAYAYVTSENQA